VRSETFADHYSQARQFYISQTPVEQTHMANALTFELSKVERMSIRKRMVGHLRHIDDGLAQEVADGLGLAELPEKVPAARDPITDLPESPALSIVRNGPGNFKGRKLGIYIAEGGDADVVKALRSAAEGAGGMVEIVAPHVGGAKLSDGTLMEADEKIDGGPSVTYDAVAVVMSEASARRYNTDKPSVDFVNDAFAHAKFVAYVPAVQPLFETAGVWNWMDDGFVDVSSGKDAASDFIEKCGSLRFWDRESVKQD
jgi:catalase